MNLPNAKDLKKLADACRKAGIRHFKSGDIEFTLTEEAPPSKYKRSTKAKSDFEADTTRFESDSPSPDELLFWSAGNPEDEESAPQ